MSKNGPAVLPKPIRCRAGTRNGRISTRPWRRMTLKRWGLPGRGLPKRFGKILCNWGARHYGNFLGPFHAIYLSCGFIIRTFQYNKIWTIHGFPYLKVRWDQRKIVVPGFTYFKLWFSYMEHVPFIDDLAWYSNQNDVFQSCWITRGYQACWIYKQRKMSHFH